MGLAYMGLAYFGAGIRGVRPHFMLYNHKVTGVYSGLYSGLSRAADDDSIAPVNHRQGRDDQRQV